MNKIIPILTIFIISFIGCKKIDEWTQFDMDYVSYATIPSTIGINLPINIYTPDIETNVEQTLEFNDTRKDLIEEILLEKLSIGITSLANKNFDFLKSISIYIEGEGLPEIKMAWKDNISDNVGNYLILETTSTDLKEYIKLSQFKLRVNSITDKLVLSEYDLEIKSTFFVDAKILGI